jgi:crossover junction endodeoxyribonuclease RusA
MPSAFARITLPWPPKDVSPNSRGHWSKKARATKAYRDACGWECVAQNVRPVAAKSVRAVITFHAPDRRPRDIDNMLSSCKAAIDAVAWNIGVDDSRWSITIARGEPKPKVGAVVIELEAA